MTKRRAVVKLLAVVALTGCDAGRAKPGAPRDAGVMTPRVLRDGRPACGNVLTKGRRCSS